MKIIKIWFLAVIVSLIVLSGNISANGAEKEIDFKTFINKVWLAYNNTYTPRKILAMNKLLDNVRLDPSLSLNESIYSIFNPLSSVPNSNILSSTIDFRKFFRYGTSIGTQLDFDNGFGPSSSYNSKLRIDLFQPLFSKYQDYIIADKIKHLDFLEDDIHVIRSENNTLANAIQCFYDFNRMDYKQGLILETIDYLKDLLQKMESMKASPLNVIHVKLALNLANQRLLDAESQIRNYKSNLALLINDDISRMKIPFKDLSADKTLLFSEYETLLDNQDTYLLKICKISVDVFELRVKEVRNKNKIDGDIRGSADFYHCNGPLNLAHPNYTLSLNIHLDILQNYNNLLIQAEESWLSNAKQLYDLTLKKTRDASASKKESLQRTKKNLDLIKEEIILIKEQIALEKSLTNPNSDDVSDLLASVKNLEDKQYAYYEMIMGVFRDYYGDAAEKIELSELLGIKKI